MVSGVPGEGGGEVVSISRRTREDLVANGKVKKKDLTQRPQTKNAEFTEKRNPGETRTPGCEGCGTRLRMKAITGLVVLFMMSPSSWLKAQSPPLENEESTKNAAVKYLRADASLRQSYALPPDAAAKLQKALESPLNAEDEKLVAAADEALVEFHHGASLKRCDWAMSAEDGPLANAAHRGAIKELVAVAGIRARLRFRDGNIPGAMDDVLAAMAAARHLSVDGSLASVLFAYKMENSVTGVLARNLLQLSPAQLRELASGLNSLPSGSNLGTALVSEKLGRNELLAIAQNANTRVELIEQLLHNIPALQSNRELAVQIVDGCGGSVKGFVSCVDQQHSFYESWAPRFALPPEQFEKAYKVDFDEISKTNPVARQFTPALPRFRWTEADEQTRRALLQSAISVRLLGPEALNQHKDPYDNKPFTYTAVDGGFRLESRLTDGGIPISLSIMQSSEEQKAIPK
jgi:hypothetical protein